MIAFPFPPHLARENKAIEDWMGKALDAWNDRFKEGEQDPEGVVTANIGCQYIRTTGGASTTLYVKESNNGEPTGWVAK